MFWSFARSRYKSTKMLRPNKYICRGAEAKRNPRQVPKSKEFAPTHGHSTTIQLPGLRVPRSAEVSRKGCVAGSDRSVFQGSRPMELPDLGLRNRRFQGVPFRFKNNLVAREHWQRRPSQKRDGQFPNTEQRMVCFLHQLDRNNSMMSNLGRKPMSWHAACIDCWYQPNKYYEQPIRIHLRSLSTLRRKRPWRARDFSLRRFYSRCRLIDRAVRADSCQDLCTWTRAVRSLPYDYDTASCRELI